MKSRSTAVIATLLAIIGVLAFYYWYTPTDTDSIDKQSPAIETDIDDTSSDTLDQANDAPNP